MADFIKVNKSRYIALFVVSRPIKKLFLFDYVNTYLFSIFLNSCCQYLLSLNIFFNIFCQYLYFLNIFLKRLCPVEKCGIIIQHYLYRDSLT